MFTYVPSTPDGRTDGVQKIADRLYPETPGIDPFWIASARSLFVGISLYLFETPSLPEDDREKCAGKVWRATMKGSRGIGAELSKGAVQDVIRSRPNASVRYMT